MKVAIPSSSVTGVFVAYIEYKYIVSLDSEFTVSYMFLCIEVWPKNERLSGIDADTCETRALCYSEISCLTQTYTSCDR